MGKADIQNQINMLNSQIEKLEQEIKAINETKEKYEKMKQPITNAKSDLVSAVNSTRSAEGTIGANYQGSDLSQKKKLLDSTKEWLTNQSRKLSDVLSEIEVQITNEKTRIQNRQETIERIKSEVTNLQNQFANTLEP